MMNETYRSIITTALTVIAMLVLVSIALSEPVPEYISSVEIHVDGFICATCVRTIERALEQEKGVAEVTGDWEKGIVAVIPDQNVGWVNLFDFVQSINSTRNYTVLKMDVVALGHLDKFPVEYYRGGLYDQTADRYKLQIGENYFILAENDELDELVNSGHKIVRVEGTVAAFPDRKPILQIREFHKIGGEEEAKISQSMARSSEALPDRIVSIGMHVDGFICATCTRLLESALSVEEGVSSVNADLETGIVTVTPSMDGDRAINLADLERRIDRLPEYTVRKMDVIAVGSLVKYPKRYYDARQYTHNHDRYKLQVGDTFFELSQNSELEQLLETGYDRARVMGTVSAFYADVPVLLIADFEQPWKETVTYSDPLDAIRASLVKEKQIMEKPEHAKIDSIRVYVDGFICAACEGPLRRDVLEEEGVEIVATDPNLGLIEIVPKPEADAILELHDIEQRINAMREYRVLKMDVVASGMVSEFEVAVIGEEKTYPTKANRYRLTIGDYVSFILADNAKLKEIVESGDEYVTVIGTVTAFRAKTPILDIKDYKKLERTPEWLK